MHKQTKPHPLNNLSLKIVSLLFGYTLWTTISTSQKISLTLKAPLSFFHEEQKIIDAPEYISVNLMGKRSEFYKLPQTLAFHIDADLLSTGNNILFLDKKQLFLPPSIQLISYAPSQIQIMVKEEITI